MKGTDNWKMQREESERMRQSERKGKKGRSTTEALNTSWMMAAVCTCRADKCKKQLDE